MGNIDKSSKEQTILRKKIMLLLKNTYLPEEQLINHLNLFNRSSLFARYLHYYELYNMIKNNIGLILVYGFNFGSILTSFLSLRAILEPYNYSRKIVGFENSCNSVNLSYYNRDHNNFTNDKYGFFEKPKNYQKHILELIKFHEEENLFSHIEKIKLYFNDPYSDTKEQFKNVKDVKISLVYFDRTFCESIDELLNVLACYIDSKTIFCPSTINSFRPTGELDSLRNVFGKDFNISNSKYIADKSYITFNL